MEVRIVCLQIRIRSAIYPNCHKNKYIDTSTNIIAVNSVDSQNQVSVEPAERQDLNLIGLDLLSDSNSDSHSGYASGISRPHIVHSSSQNRR